MRDIFIFIVSILGLLACCIYAYKIIVETFNDIFKND